MRYHRCHNSLLNAAVRPVIRRRVTMKSLSKQEADRYLALINMRIGEWNQIVGNEASRVTDDSWITYRAPRDSQTLLSFSQHVAGWVPKGVWKILQIDNSTSLDAVQENFLGRLLFGPAHVSGLDGCKTFLFEFGMNQEEDRNAELIISDLIFAFLLFECHGYLVSSGCGDGSCLGIQDGFVYFSTGEKNVHGVHLLLENFERNPLDSPPWIVEIIT